MNFSAVILAGGKSSRMGRDKALLEVSGQSLLARQIQLARDAGADEAFISGRAGADYTAFNCPVLRDRVAESGPLGGIDAALVATTAPLLLVLAVDMPEMSADFLQRLAAECADGCGAIPRVGEFIEPLAAFYPKAALSLVTELLDAGSTRSGGTGFQPVRCDIQASRRLETRSFAPPDRLEACPTSAKHFAECCVATGLATFVDLPTTDAHFFTNWNSPADLPCLT